MYFSYSLIVYECVCGMYVCVYYINVYICVYVRNILSATGATACGKVFGVLAIKQYQSKTKQNKNYQTVNSCKWILAVMTVEFDSSRHFCFVYVTGYQSNIF